MTTDFSFAVTLLLVFVDLCVGAPSSADRRPWTPDYTPDYVLVATAENVAINCLSRYSVIFNGSLPGPPLYMREGSTTWVRVYNNMEDQNVTVHWHGLSQRADIFSDGTPQVAQWPIAPSNYFDYAITPQAGDAGSYFYHSHVGFQAITAHGAIIVDSEDGTAPYTYDEDISLLFQDFYNKNDSVIEKGLVANPFVWSGEPEAILVNGKSGNTSFSNASDATCTPEIINVEPGKTYRLRFISGTALSFVTLGLEDHNNLTIIEADGEYTQPWSTDRLQFGSGQRFSLLFQAKSSEELQSLGKSDFWLRYENRDRPTNVSGYALLRYNVENQPSLPSDLPANPPVVLPRDRKNVTGWSEYSLSSLNASKAADFPRLNEVTRTVTITMNQIVRDGFYNGSFHGVVQWAQNGLPWQEASSASNHTVPYLIQVYTSGKTPNYTAAVANNGWDPTDNNHAFPALVGEVLDIVWLSNSGPSGGWDFHPMHAHGAHFWDLGSGNGTYDATENEKHFESYTPAKRDTTILHRYATKGEAHTTAGWRAWRIRVTEDNVGAWMMHCHALAHMVMGMQTVWVFGDAASILAQFPVQPYVNGYLNYGGDAYGNETYDPFADGIYNRR